MVPRCDEPHFKRDVEMWTKITGNECGIYFFGCSIISVCLPQNRSPFLRKRKQELMWRGFEVTEQICREIYETATRALHVDVEV